MKSLSDWLTIIPEEWHHDAEQKWGLGYRVFGKAVVKPGYIDPDTKDLIDGKRIGEIRILEYPEDPPVGCVYVLASSVSGAGWTYSLPGPKIAGNDPDFFRLLSHVVKRQGDGRARFIDRGSKLIDQDLPQWLAYGNEVEKKMAEEIQRFLDDAFADDGDNELLKGIFFAGFQYHQMMIRHLQVEDAEKNLQPGYGLRAIVRQALQIHGNLPAVELLRKMGAKPEGKNLASWIFPDGSTYTQTAFAKTVSNERNGN